MSPTGLQSYFWGGLMAGCCLQRAQSRDLGQLGSSGDVLEVITEVDAWDKARSALESGLTPQQVVSHPSVWSPTRDQPPAHADSWTASIVCTPGPMLRAGH